MPFHPLSTLSVTQNQIRQQCVSCEAWNLAIFNEIRAKYDVPKYCCKNHTFLVAAEMEKTVAMSCIAALIKYLDVSDNVCC